MNNYTMPVKAIKNILAKELSGLKQGFYNAYPSFIMADVQKEMVSIAYETALHRLNDCQSYDDLENFVSFIGYRMSLQDWINSL